MLFIHFIDKDTVHLSRTKLPLQPTRAFLGIILLSLRSYFHLKFFNKFFPNIFSQISGLPSRIDMGLTGKSCCLEIRDQHVCHSATFSSSPDLVESLNLAQPQAYSHLSPCHILLWLAWQTSPSDDPLSLPLPVSRKGGGAGQKSISKLMCGCMPHRHLSHLASDAHLYIPKHSLSCIFNDVSD